MFYRLKLQWKKLLLQKKDIFIYKGAYLDDESTLEGHNVLYENSSIIKSTIGMGTYISSNSQFIQTDVGRFCSIGARVNTIVGKHPYSPNVSTHPAFFSTLKQSGFSFTDKQLVEEFNYQNPSLKRSINIGHDVWIGADVKILEGIKIGNGAIIGAGSVVTKDIPPYEIWCGNPAKRLKCRFSEEDITFLEKVKWWNKNFTWIQKHYKSFNNIESLKKLLS